MCVFLISSQWDVNLKKKKSKKTANFEQKSVRPQIWRTTGEKAEEMNETAKWLERICDRDNPAGPDQRSPNTRPIRSPPDCCQSDLLWIRRVPSKPIDFCDCSRTRPVRFRSPLLSVSTEWKSFSRKCPLTLTTRFTPFKSQGGSVNSTFRWKMCQSQWMSKKYIDFYLIRHHFIKRYYHGNIFESK